MILKINDGFFLLLFDDAYIHFEQARNILAGHYGHNPGEISAPNSSILWPFILAPLTPLPFFEWAVLLLNLGIVIAIVRIQYNIITPMFSRLPERLRTRRGQALRYLLLISLIFIPNLILLLFSGMETPLQILLAHLILLGLIREHQTGRMPAYLTIALLLSPLIRYESLALVCPALIRLFSRNHRAGSVLTGLIMGLTLFLFSYYLYRHGIGMLPTSITAKTIHQNGFGNPLRGLGINIFLNLTNPFSLPLILLLLSHVPALTADRWRQYRGLAAVVFSAGGLHLIFGNIGPLPLFRYEAYILSLLAVSAAWIYLADTFRYPGGTMRAVFFGVMPFLVLSLPSLIITTLVPAISNAAYRHPYQMHRLITEFYPYPAAINDLGWVTYKNSAYVLDLWGVGSIEALRCGIQRDSLSCVARLAREKGVRLVMITSAWFKNVPGVWIKIGEYYPGKNPPLLDPFVRGIVNHVDVYVTDQRYRQEAIEAIGAFNRTLPRGAEFIFSPSADNPG
ncbi:MAG: hypothetical protein AB1724_00755 [Thermodesulfobacteriota bacterium]